MLSRRSLFAWPLAAVVLGGCSNSPAQLPAAEVGSAQSKPAAKAFVVLSAATTPYAGFFGTTDLAVSTVWQTPAREFTLAFIGWGGWTGPLQSKSDPSVVEVDPGIYQLVKFSYPRGNGTANGHWGRAPGMAQISVGPGEVVYIGHVMIGTKPGTGGLFTPGNFELSVADYSADAKAALAKSRPELATKLTTRLMSINPAVRSAGQAG